MEFTRKLGLERKRKLIEFFSYYRVYYDMEGGLYNMSYQFVVNMITHQANLILMLKHTEGKRLDILCELVI